ncbi:MAG TPA: hypothetical protein VN256_08270 [Pyrinomonadaceae bacterium]|nr:hypothetical protein [Pyrinomonadaceae bacterium]
MFWPIVIVYMTPLWVWALLFCAWYTRRWRRRNRPRPVEIECPEKVIGEIRVRRERPLVGG